MKHNDLERYNLWIEKTSLNKLRELAKTDPISISAFIRIAIKEKIENYLDKKKK